MSGAVVQFQRTCNAGGFWVTTHVLLLGHNKELESICLALTGFSGQSQSAMKKSRAHRVIGRAHLWPVYATHTFRLLATRISA